MRDPFDVPGGNISSHWEPEPNARGTWAILSTCLVTMALCVWSALHINIPEPEGKGKNIARKAWWVLLGVFAPEMIALSAVHQNVNARHLTAGMRKHFRQDKSCSSVKNAFRKALSRLFGYRQAIDESFEMDESHGTGMPLRSNAWTMTHSHYALMGGYAISDLSPPSNIFPNRRTRLVLTPAALLFLAEHYPDQIPDLTEEEILDKSKANSLAKAIVCMQALWFCIQCVSRLAGGLSISLLELNTFGHSICALIIYLQWWNKPLDIALPSIISISGNEGLFCAMIMESTVGRAFNGISQLQQEPRTRLINPFPPRKDFQQEIDFVIRPIPGLTSGFKETLRNFIQVFHTLVTTRSCKVTKEVCVALKLNTIAQGQFHNENFKEAAIAREFTNQLVNVHAGYSIRPYFRLMSILPSSGCQHESQRGHLVERFGILGQFKLWWLFTSADLTRLELANAYHHDTTPRLPKDTNFVTYRIRNFLDRSGTVSRSELSYLVQVTVATVPTFLYGMTHIIAWNAPFPSRIQSIMWRVSGVTLFIPTIAVAILYLFSFIAVFSKSALSQILPVHPMLSSLAKRLSKYWEMVLHSKAFQWMMMMPRGLIGIFSISAFGLYIVARFFLILECFISLTYVPYTVFIVPNWSSYIPHIG